MPLTPQPNSKVSTAAWPKNLFSSAPNQIATCTTRAAATARRCSTSTLAASPWPCTRICTPPFLRSPKLWPSTATRFVLPVAFVAVVSARAAAARKPGQTTPLACLLTSTHVCGETGCIFFTTSLASLHYFLPAVHPVQLVC